MGLSIISHYVYCKQNKDWLQEFKVSVYASVWRLGNENKDAKTSVLQGKFFAHHSTGLIFFCFILTYDFNDSLSTKPCFIIQESYPYRSSILFKSFGENFSVKIAIYVEMNRILKIMWF